MSSSALTQDLFVVVGCGGIGYHLVEPLARVLISKTMMSATRGVGAKLVLIDGDVIERGNLSRVFGEDMIGQSKAYALANSINNLLPSLDIVVVGNYLEGPKQFSEVLTELASFNSCVHVFGCVDNNATRVLIERGIDHYIQRNSGSIVALIDGGNALIEGQARLAVVTSRYTAEQKEATPEVFTKLTERHPDLLVRASEEDDLPTRRHCTDEYISSPQLALTNNLVAALMLSLWYSRVASLWYQSADTRLDLEHVLCGHGDYCSTHVGKIAENTSVVNQIAFDLHDMTISCETITPFVPMTQAERDAEAARSIVVGL